MPYVDRKNRTCGFLDIEDAESGRFLRRYFILDTQANHLIWHMDNPQNLPRGTGAVGSLRLTYISKVSIAAAKQKSKLTNCFVINALSQRYFLQASDQKDLQGWVDALNAASKITVPRPGSAQTPEIGSTGSGSQEKKAQTAYKTEIIGGVVVQTPISQNGSQYPEVIQHEAPPHNMLRRSHSLMPQFVHKPSSSVCALKSGYCVKQGNMRKNWKRRFFVLSAFNISYYKCETDREPLRCIHLRDILKTHECLVKSGDLLMRDNLFEVITSPRTFYIQTDSPQEMHSWIKAINAAIQTLRTRCRESFARTMSLNRASVPASSSTSTHSLPPSDVKRPLGKSVSIKSSWQPWTPVPKCEKESAGEITLAGSLEGEFGVRARQMSEPQRLKDDPFLPNLDNIRTSDV
ncbi:pleckstrin homology domain-containing family A member 2 [Bufo gargarizans]|uniref:pleckstrin homology domain-containing family A member 2 n=1 Tax=Bufo gargarizans TaxID=30331 RepID=UPI001CF3BD10|nr:pleckstrin homology domain-containing family A member 2 [Bufo gargarizans]XP_044134983.1 pleckstrin homology domain-containing family A member 2 [Bufo gargarizans]